MISLKEYVDALADGQEKIYYACGETYDKIDLMPQVESFKDKDYDVLYLKDYIDEFAVRMLREYEGKEFTNISNEDVNLGSEEDKKIIEEENDNNKDMLGIMKEVLSD